MLVQAEAAQEVHVASYQVGSGFHNLSRTHLEATIMIDEVACVRFWNGDAERMFGYAPNETIGKLAVPFFFFQEPFRTLFLMDLDAGRLTVDSAHTSKAILVQGRTKDGINLPLEVSLSAWKHYGHSLIAFTARLSQ